MNGQSAYVVFGTQLKVADKKLQPNVRTLYCSISAAQPPV